MSKRILITGMNNLQSTNDFCFRQNLKVTSVFYSLTRCLTDMGYEVEHRPVDLGEDLSDYEDVICFIHTPKTFCQKLYAGLYAIAARPDCIIAMDDWQVDQIVAGIDEFYRTIDDFSITYKDYFFSLYSGKEKRDEVVKYHTQIKTALEIIRARKNRLLTVAFAGGDIDLLKSGWDKSRIYTYNPNPYHLNRTPENDFGRGATFFSSEIEPEEKKMEWVFASLVQNKTRKWLKEQKIGWPISYYGCKRGEFKSPRVTEDVMCEIYHSNWGCLTPCYYNAGSGFWRPRALQVANAGSILLVDDREGKIYSEAHVGLTASMIERMDLTQLIGLASRQFEGIYDNHPLDKRVTRRELQSALDSIK